MTNEQKLGVPLTMADPDTSRYNYSSARSDHQAWVRGLLLAPGESVTIAFPNLQAALRHREQLIFEAIRNAPPTTSR